MSIAVTTIAEIVLQELGVISVGQTPDADLLDVVIKRLNLMLDNWNAKKINVYYNTREDLTLTASTNPHTIGTGGTLNTARPVRIMHARLADSSNNEYLLTEMTEGEYEAISLKTTSSIPSKFWYDPEYPLGKIYFDYVPDAAYTLALSSQKKLSAALESDDTLDLPEGYETAIIYNLAVFCAPVFRRNLTAATISIATDALNTIQNNNLVIEPHKWDQNMFVSRRAL